MISYSLALQDADRPTSNPLPPESEAFVSAFAEYRNSLVSGQDLIDSVARQVPNFGTEQVFLLYPVFLFTIFLVALFCPLRARKKMLLVQIPLILELTRNGVRCHGLDLVILSLLIYQRGSWSPIFWFFSFYV